VQNETSYRRFSKLIFNPKNEITNAVMGQNAFAWTLDPIGNRISATKNEEPESYSANQLNQYTQISDGVTNFPTYDLDGNMLSYNGWVFSWNGENRLIQASNATHVISYAYDYQGRMFQKVVDGVTNNCVWDGWLPVQELVTQGSSITTNSYVWGLDLSGSLQGAGGIGGLLSCTRGPPGTNWLYLADGNGNVTEVLDAGNPSSILAHYEFDAYGNLLASSGPEVLNNHFLFSTKYWDDETGLGYWGYRWLQDGRWMSRVPAEEEGGLNLYTFSENQAISLVDLLGQAGWDYNVTATLDIDDEKPGYTTKIDITPPAPASRPVGSVQWWQINYWSVDSMTEACEWDFTDGYITDARPITDPIHDESAYNPYTCNYCWIHRNVWKKSGFNKKGRTKDEGWYKDKPTYDAASSGMRAPSAEFHIAYEFMSRNELQCQCCPLWKRKVFAEIIEYEYK